MDLTSDEDDILLVNENDNIWHKVTGTQLLAKVMEMSFKSTFYAIY